MEQSAAPPLTVRPVAVDDWPLVEQLFGSNGACGGCWCMHWLAPVAGRPWEQTKGEPNRLALKALVEAGDCPAVIALAGDLPVGWCRVGPIESFPRLRRSRKLWRARMADWAIICLFVTRTWRGRGLSSRLATAAADLAFAGGAHSVEGYGTIPTSGTIPGAFAWTGLPGTFEKAGFGVVDHDAGSRRVYRLNRR